MTLIKHFGIAVGPEHAAQSLQLFTQSTIVVNLAVEADDPAAGRITHRLRTRGPGIDNGKTPVTEHDASIFRGPKTCAIRTAPALLIVQALDNGLVYLLRSETEGEGARNAAHV